MTKIEFHQLLQRYLQGNCTKEEMLKIHRWYSLLENQSQLDLTHEEKDQLEHRLWANINDEIDESEKVIPLTSGRRKNKVFVYAGVAAACVIITVASFLFFTRRIFPEKEISVFETNIELVSEQNQSTIIKKIVLQDKSIIHLSPNSSISYPKIFDSHKREIQLVGDAFFEITKDPEKPFLVYTGRLVTKVLGTSFWIKTKDQSNSIEVDVATGKVSVYENSAESDQNITASEKPTNNGVILTPNQRVEFFEKGGHWVTGLVEKPIEIKEIKNTPLPEKLVYNDKPILEILSGLEQRYGIEIVPASEKLNACTFTGDITEMPLYEKLDLLCQSIGATYEIKGTRILISGNGCD
ncbi:FecR family protein [Cytophagaceae bacterium DM2B3-1]|uniref:FecR family protein n=1 Tax=Xanthocytophaga flava TaxID=3048013 RepID=A0ABT7CSK8_9BACT|nr:FecR family protein [Xanthocytophaga flavus]MDJ1471395.1 FecR family protein [Xanthocytophaga flavus]MDJ1496729.1 FecR family protein [Xanthocytophaga flavus]